MRRGIIALAILCLPTFAQANPHHHYKHHRQHRDAVPGAAAMLAPGLIHMLHSMGPRPHAWCGYYMRELLGVPDTSYNLAQHWRNFGRPAMGPHVGAIVVWSHHVGIIVGGERGAWVVKSGNDGHAVRERVRSVAGAIAFRDPL